MSVDSIYLNSLALRVKFNVYEKNFSDPLINSISEIKKEIELLFLSGDISKKLYNAIKIDGKLGSFRILPKIHKNFSTKNSIKFFFSKYRSFIYQNV